MMKLKLVVEEPDGSTHEEEFDTESERSAAATAHHKRGARTLGIGSTPISPEEEKAAEALFARFEAD